MSSPLTVAWTGNSHTAALILKGLLTSVGIPAKVAGEELMDEFAQASRMSGGLGQILVPKTGWKRPWKSSGSTRAGAPCPSLLMWVKRRAKARNTPLKPGTIP